MFELELYKYERSLNDIDPAFKNIDKPFIFYLNNRDDFRSFFNMFVVVDFIKETIIYYSTYSQHNIDMLEKQADKDIFKVQRTVHCTLEVKEGEEFLTFMEEECFFFHMNLKTLVLTVYTMNDLVKDSNVNLTRICSTFYLDDLDHNYFYISAVGTDDYLRIYRVSLSLNQVKEVDKLPGISWPPHVLRKYHNLLFLSNEFRFSNYISQKDQKVLSGEMIKRIIFRQMQRMQSRNSHKNDNLQGEQMYSYLNMDMKNLYLTLRDKYDIRCLPGRILMIDENTGEKQYYETSGGSPAHFEIDEENGLVYTSSHNFIMNDQMLILNEPAVIDKFKVNGSSLDHIGAFKFSEGYRYTTHRLFYHEGKQYIVTFAEPNRLIFIDAQTMELLFFYDVDEQNLLSNNDDIGIYINCMVNGKSYLALEVTSDGEYIFFLGYEEIYIFHFKSRKVVAKQNYKNFIQGDLDLDRYGMKTAHLYYISRC